MEAGLCLSEDKEHGDPTRTRPRSAHESVDKTSRADWPTHARRVLTGIITVYKVLIQRLHATISSIHMVKQKHRDSIHAAPGADTGLQEGAAWSPARTGYTPEAGSCGAPRGPTWAFFLS